jgi:hypothetical protein
MECGSDKSSAHDYHLVYGEIIQALGHDNPLHILEIGIGSNDPLVPSNMGQKGRPGASLRAFKAILPQALIFGADVDAKTMFSESRIQTALVDQMDIESFATMQRSFGNPGYDLIIDDGFHFITANLNTLLFALSVLNENGWIVIEDIGERATLFWHSICGLIPDHQYYKQLIKGKSGYLFVLNRK